ncbi:hypothetical protein MCG98_17210 [Ruminococcus sp. OA3]|uniref:hypothetical protein n=1 Tax=Ruminococcus sp. OA3 TaxID=2914164 RepID=UPI001F06A2D7|nr:hypothetical protein [Ruminococcus sp. OA3]MCH1984309.1 hypothetical protein [Ruminococcus sp. OA3]
MSSKTKIVVLHMKEVIYTAIFLTLAILLIILLFVMFGPKKSTATSADASEETAEQQYVAGVYTTSIELNDNTFDVQVTVDSDHINSIELINLSESATAMYPLMEPTLDALAEQIYQKQSTENITYEDDNKYTSMLLLEAIKTALSKAVPQS